ncbi:MAG: NnrU family protein [Candidatus Binatia bacterium]
MISLVLAAAFFVGIHVFISGTSLRAAIVSKTGERAFQGLFSLLSLGGIVWMIQAYRHAPDIALWGQVDALRPAALLLMIVAFLFVVIGLATPSPTAVGGESQLDQQEPATGLLRITRHPFLWGVAIWAFTHLVINGDAAAVALFGGFLLLALVGPLSIDAKRKRAFGHKWDRFAAVTSNVPFAAIIQGRNTLKLGELGWLHIAAGLLFYAVVLVSHQWLFGASPFPA